MFKKEAKTWLLHRRSGNVLEGHVGWEILLSTLKNTIL
jgi:hypothetical protein